MQDEYRNLYYNARRTAGLTQERWAEALGISVESVRLYESGVNMPSDEIALRMAEVAGQQIICYWHLLQKSKAAACLLPKVERRALPESVLNLLVKVKEFLQDGMQDLTRIAADGKVDETEVKAYGHAMMQLRELLAAGMCVEYADKEGER